MKLHRVFLIALLTSTFGVLGCDSSSESASEVCDRCNAPSQRGDCERVFNLCVETGDAGSHEDCAAAGLAACGAV
jgi:hypothetical protein